MNLPMPDLHLPWLADASLRLSFIIAAFLVMRPLLRRFAGSAWLGVLWLMLLARLLAPWPLATPFGWEGRAPAVELASGQTPAGYEVRTRVIEDAAYVAPTAPVVKQDVAASDSRRSGWREVWLAGVVLGVAALAVRTAHTARLARKTGPARDARLRAVFGEIPEAWRRGVELRETDALGVPTLAGIVRPQIWMPRAWLAQLSNAELSHVLLHELGHARRRDLLVQWLFSLAVCVHWFNPLVWLAARCARADREMACDAWVLARSRDVAPGEYGATLLKTVALLREPLRLAPHAVAMGASRRGLVSRITTIGGFRALPAWRGIAGLFALGAVLAVATTTRLAAQAPTPAPAPQAEAKKAPDSKASVNTAGPEASPAEKQNAAPFRPAPPQVEISARFVEISDSAAKKLESVKDPAAFLFGGKMSAAGGMAGMLTEENMDRVCKTFEQVKGADLLSTPRVTTRSGQPAVIEIINEFIYPTEWKPDDGKPPVMQPTSFETRNCGISLEVAPTVSEDGQVIDLQLKPQLVELTGYNRIGPGGASTVIKVPSGKFSEIPGNATKAKSHGVTAGPGEILQPIFSTLKLETSVTIHNSQTVVLGGLRRAGRIDDKGNPIEPSQLFIFITAKIISATGEPTASPVTNAEAGAQKSAERWLSDVDAGKYDESWQSAAAFFRAAVSQEQWRQSLGSARKPLGGLVSRKLKSAVPAKSLPGAPDSDYVVLQFDTSFANKQQAVETVTPMLEKDGQWKVSGYYIK